LAKSIRALRRRAEQGVERCLADHDRQQAITGAVREQRPRLLRAVVG